MTGTGRTGFLGAFRVYRDRRMVLIAVLGFASGLPLAANASIKWFTVEPVPTPSRVCAGRRCTAACATRCLAKSCSFIAPDNSAHVV